MNYELAKQLKDAGFPSKKYGKYYSDSLVLSPCLPEFEISRQDKRLLAFKINSFIHEGLVPEGDDVVYIPNLEELIKACGDNFRNLGKTESGDWGVNMSIIASDVGRDMFTVWEIKGKTPLEAVANLWLKLNSTQ